MRKLLLVLILSLTGCYVSTEEQTFAIDEMIEARQWQRECFNSNGQTRTAIGCNGQVTITCKRKNNESINF